MLGNQGQQIGEYAVLIGIVAMAFVATQLSISRAVGGRLIQMSHTALGTALPDGEGVSNSSSIDTVRELGDASLIQTVATSRAFGDSHAGFILAEPHGPSVFDAFKKDALSNGVSGAQVLFQLPENVPELEGYEFSGDYFTDENGQTIGIFKKGASVKKRGYKVLDQPIFDPATGTWFTGLDLDGNGKYDAGTDLRTAAMLDGNVLIFTTSERIKAYGEWLNGFKEFLGIEDLEIPDGDRADIEDVVEGLESALAGIDRGHLNEASPEELEKINSAFDSLAPALGKADAAVTRSKEADKEKILEAVAWPLSLDGESRSGFEMINAAKDMGKLVKEFEASDEEQERSIKESRLGQLADASGLLTPLEPSLPHAEEIEKHLEAAWGSLNELSWGPQGDDDSRTNAALTAWGHLQAAHDLLEQDVDAYVGLTAETEPDEAGQGIEVTMLAEFSGQPSTDQFLQDQQYDIDGDTLVDVIRSEDGQAQGFGYVVFKESDMFAEDGGGMTVSNVSSELSAAMTRAEPHEVLKAYPGPPPAELIAAAGMHPDDLEGTEAWIPLSKRAALIGEMAETGALDLGLGGTQAPPYNPPVDPNDYTFTPH